MLTSVIIGVGLGLIALLLYEIWQLRRGIEQSKRELSHVVGGFLVSPDGHSPSPLATVVNDLAVMVGQSVSAHIKATLMGVESGDARGERALKTDVLLDTSPLLAGIASSFPHVAKRINKNPELASVAMNLLANMGNVGKGAPNNGNGGGHYQTTFPM